jgi:hypothetical protein
MPARAEPRWLLLIHQIPPKPSYLRVKVGAPGRDTVEGLLAGIEARLRPAARDTAAPPATTPADVRSRTWVTRRGIHVDRMASAWLIRRFIDPEARLEFVPGNEYAPRGEELRFDMFQAEFTPTGSSRSRFCCATQLAEPALRNLAEIVRYRLEGQVRVPGGPRPRPPARRHRDAAPGRRGGVGSRVTFGLALRVLPAEPARPARSLPRPRPSGPVGKEGEAGLTHRPACLALEAAA